MAEDGKVKSDPSAESIAHALLDRLIDARAENIRRCGQIGYNGHVPTISLREGLDEAIRLAALARSREAKRG